MITLQLSVSMPILMKIDPAVTSGECDVTKYYFCMFWYLRFPDNLRWSNL